jgi:hypothetical protein
VADNSEDINDADEMIREDGELVTVTLETPVVTNPDRPWEQTAGVPLTWEDVPVCYIPDNSAAFRAYMKGTDIPSGAALAYMSAKIDFEPTLEHVINSPSRGKLKIDSFDKLAPGSQTIMHILRLVQ